MRVKILNTRYPREVLDFLRKELPRHLQVSDFQVIEESGLSGVSFQIRPEDVDWAVCVLTNVFDNTGLYLDIPAIGIAARFGCPFGFD